MQARNPSGSVVEAITNFPKIDEIISHTVGSIAVPHHSQGVDLKEWAR
ncbi:hypothetical protein [Pseudomonas mediterranea]|nr:hypothetical protein [Pseudomonas mediterranea]